MARHYSRMLAAVATTLSLAGQAGHPAGTPALVPAMNPAESATRTQAAVAPAVPAPRAPASMTDSDPAVAVPVSTSSSRAMVAPSTHVVPPLTWDALRNSSYPSDLAPTRVVKLTNGVYRAKLHTNPGTDVTVRLADKHAFGDLNGDGSEDAVVIVAEEPDGHATSYQLVAVLNRQGVPAATASQDLGDRIAITSLRLVSGHVVVTLMIFGSGTPGCCPQVTSTRTYEVLGHRFVLLTRRDIPGAGSIPQVALRPVERIVFPPGGTSAVVRRTIGPNGIDPYVLHADAGQTMSVVIRSVHHDVLLSCYGLAEHRVLAGIQTEATAWRGTIPSTQDYVIKAVTAADAPAVYTLQVTVVGPVPPVTTPPVSPPQPPVSPLSPAGKIVYLTFDDGPGPTWTPKILALLERYHAHATFFVIGENVVQYPGVVRAEAAAGDAVGNHTWNHQSLDGIGRQGFFDEVLRTKAAIKAALGPRGNPAPCLRPPYGATDAFTYVYAEELGLTVVLWNVDPQDWSRPGVSAIVSRILSAVYPGAIVLMHDGGGDRSETVGALGSVLDTLSSRGYRFVSRC